MKRVKLFNEDNLQALKKLPDNSIDSVVSDPPYALTSIKKRFGKEGSAEAKYGTDGLFQRASKGFMGKEWDAEVPRVEFWREVYRVLKPGGHVLSFGGTRTYHRMVVNMEDAGFEIRDQIMWIYGSGFPKSHNIGKAVDKLNGVEREVVGKSPNERLNKSDNDSWDCNGVKKELNITKGSSEYEGWGTALKPANEPICLARKPLSENSIAENVLKWKTGGINVDGCRVGTNGGTMKVDINKDSDTMFEGGRHNSGKVQELNEGRFPANIILECCCDEVIEGEKGEPRYGRKGGTNESEFSKAISPNPEHIGKWFNDKGDIHTNPECPCYIMDQQSGESKSNCKSGVVEGKEAGQMYHRHEQPNNNYKNKIMVGDYNDKGGASRFFYQAKVSKAERNMGLDGFEEKQTRMKNIDGEKTNYQNENVAAKYQAIKSPAKNNHPTVKPINLLTYLCRLVTPPNGIVLDPFMGSGSTGIAAQLEGFRFVGMELDEDYFKIAEARIENFQKYEKFIKKV